jgi:hypothetical protein
MMKMRLTVMKRAEALKQHLTPGRVYRREDLTRWSNAVDRHLKVLQAEGVLTKLSAGVYYYPERTVFGHAPAKDTELVRAFLRDERFLLTSANAYNALGLGLTQLYNEAVVYNHKRHGRFVLGERNFDFRMRPHFPNTLSEAFLLVDVVNNLDRLAEDINAVREQIQQRVSTMDAPDLQEAVNAYGTMKTRKWFSSTLPSGGLSHG